MTLRQNTAEGQTSGTALTAANSGGGSGDAFNSKTGSGVIAYSNAQAAHGTQSLLINETTLGGYVTWSGMSGTNVASRAYVRWVAVPTALQDVMFVESPSGTILVRVTSAGLLRVTNIAGSTLFTFATAMTTGQWYRLEVRAVAGTGTTDGTIGCAYYLADSTTPVETAYLATNVNAGTTAFTGGRYMKLTSAAAQNAYWDDMAFNDAAAGAFIGPPVTSIDYPRTASGTGSGTGSASVAVAASATTSGAGAGAGSATVSTVAVTTATSGTGAGGSTATVTTANVTATTTGSGAGSGTAAAATTATVATSGTGLGTGTASASAQVARTTAGTSSGDGTATVSTAAQLTTTGSGAGTGTATATGASGFTRTTSGASAGTGTANITNTTRVTTTSGTGSGAGVAVAVVAFTTTTSGTGNGTGTAQVVVALTTTTAGSSSGDGTADDTRVTYLLVATGTSSGDGTANAGTAHPLRDVTVTILGPYTHPIRIFGPVAHAIPITGPRAHPIPLTLGGHDA